MNRLLTLSLNDFRVVFRDPMLRIFLFLPLLVITLVVWGVPFLFSVYPTAKDYDYVILMWAGLQTATMFGFICGFVFLEEKDEQVFIALRVMPITAGTLIGVRLLLGVSITLIVNILLFSLTQWVSMSWVQIIVTAFQLALLAPLLTLALVTFAQNKVEGLAQFKVYNLLAILPTLIYFLPYSVLHGLAIIPTYWTFRSIEAMDNGGPYLVYTGIGFVEYLIVLIGLGWFFEKRVF